MKRLYEKNPLVFALCWIGVYVVGFSMADGLSASLGLEKCITLPVCVVMTAILLGWLKKEGLWQYFGLCKGSISASKALYYLPLALLVSVNLWGGVKLNYRLVETVLYMLTMLGVGILEEVIFRGLLFKALCRENLKMAVIVSSLTFGFGHIINLLSGAALLPTLLQIVYATAAGFLFTVWFLRSGSLLPCILTHSAVYALSAVAAEQGPVLEVFGAAALTVVSVGYALWIIKTTKE